MAGLDWCGRGALKRREERALYSLLLVFNTFSIPCSVCLLVYDFCQFFLGGWSRL